MKFEYLNWQIRIGEEFQKCKTEKEVIWIQEQFTEMVDCLQEERLEELEKRELG